MDEDNLSEGARRRTRSSKGQEREQDHTLPQPRARSSIGV